jgi:hypothetical protein
VKVRIAAAAVMQLSLLLQTLVSRQHFSLSGNAKSKRQKRFYRYRRRKVTARLRCKERREKTDY